MFWKKSYFIIKGIKHNKFKIDNLYFEESNIKEIKLISDLKEINYKRSKIDIVNKDKPKLLIQENFIVLNYELIFWAKYHNKYYARFVQISIDKKKDKIENIIND